MPSTFFRPLAILASSLLCGLLVAESGITVWTIDFTHLRAPFAAGLMAGFLWVYWKFFSGSWPASKAGSFRKTRFRSLRLLTGAWRRSLLAGLCIVVTLEMGLALTFRLIPFPETDFKSQYKLLDSLPGWQAWVLVVVSSLVAGICEETGFRGYMQVPMEKQFGVLPGVLLVSVAFVLLHLGKTWAYSIIPLIFLTSVLLGLLASRCGSLVPGIVAHATFDVFNFSYWWSHLGGNFKRSTIFRSGIDLHFIGVTLAFAAGLTGFFLLLKKMQPGKRPRSIIPYL
jgi:membrane protease YdiL (CAAX protease family)